MQTNEWVVLLINPVPIKVKTQNFLHRYDELQRVEFERTGGTSRSFDIKITNVHDITYTFSSIGE